MSIIKWDVPVVASHRRSVELISLDYRPSQVSLVLAEEDSTRRWLADFRSVQAMKTVTWECAGHTLSGAPEGSFFEILESPMLEELGLARHEFLKKSRHFVLSTYDDILHVVAWTCTFSRSESLEVSSH